MGSDMVGIVFSAFIILLLFVLGIILRSGKGDFLISGYNLLSKEKKAQYKKDELCRYMGNLLFIADVILILALITAFYEIIWLLKLLVFLLIAFSICSFSYALLGSRFKNN